MKPIDFVRMTGPEMLEYCGQNAAKWAEAFCALKHVNGWSLNDIDQDLMETWFANAIEHSYHLRKQDGSNE